MIQTINERRRVADADFLLLELRRSASDLLGETDSMQASYLIDEINDSGTRLICDSPLGDAYAKLQAANECFRLLMETLGLSVPRGGQS